MRLLPWVGEGGRPAYLSSGDEGSFVSRLADNLESVQLGMAESLLEHVGKMVAERKPSEVELLSIVETMGQALRDTLRVAHSRGDRLPMPEDDPPFQQAAAVVDREVKH